MNTDPITDVQRAWLDGLTLPPDAVVVDVGANEGRFAEEVFGRWPGARVVCFEPQPKAASRITDRAEVRAVALGDARERRRLYCDTENGVDMSASLHVPYKDWMEVAVERLDEQGIGHIHLLKVDAEGNELAVLEGAGELLGPRVEVIQWELNSMSLAAGTSYADFWLLLSGAGYCVGEIRGGSEVVPEPEDPSFERGVEHYEMVAWRP